VCCMSVCVCMCVCVSVCVSTKIINIWFLNIDKNKILLPCIIKETQMLHSYIDKMGANAQTSISRIIL